MGRIGKLTAPYFETCRTKRAASLNNGRATMVVAGSQPQAKKLGEVPVIGIRIGRS